MAKEQWTPYLAPIMAISFPGLIIPLTKVVKESTLESMISLISIYKTKCKIYEHFHKLGTLVNLWLLNLTSIKVKEKFHLKTNDWYRWIRFASGTANFGPCYSSPSSLVRSRHWHLSRSRSLGLVPGSLISSSRPSVIQVQGLKKNDITRMKKLGTV